MIKTETSAL